jgi:hypothetical protein
MISPLLYTTRVRASDRFQRQLLCYFHRLRRRKQHSSISVLILVTYSFVTTEMSDHVNTSGALAGVESTLPSRYCPQKVAPVVALTGACMKNFAAPGWFGRGISTTCVSAHGSPNLMERCKQLEFPKILWRRLNCPLCGCNCPGNVSAVVSWDASARSTI